ncbi:GNAT family N-acetyltransferase [Thermocrinis sp.]|uniref:GNAT family N-acetyltransferase n=1 Tax=Thermocrinis sp. TaxID=2024383 RepID=UPI003C08AB65
MKRSYMVNSVVQKKQAQKFLTLVKDTLSAYEYQPKRIADLGAGDGVLTYALKRAYPNSYVLGVDKDAKVLKEASKQWQGVEFLCRDILQLEFREAFDLVVSSSVFHWLGKDWHKGVQKVWEMLEEGGWFFLHQGGRWTYYFLYDLAERIYTEMTGEVLKHTEVLFYPTLKEFKEALAKHFVVMSVFSNIEFQQDYSLEELLKSFSVAGARVFTDRLSPKQREEFLMLLHKRAVEEEIPVFGRRLYGVMRKPLTVEVVPARLEEVEFLIEKYEGEFVPPLSKRPSAGGGLEGGSLREYINSLSSAKIFAAKKDERVIGCLCYKMQALPFVSKPVLMVSTVIVEKPFRSAGVGRALYQKVLSENKELYVRTWSTNTNHLKLLKSLGFQEVYRIENHRGKGIDTVYLRYSHEGV